jgi:hypothetical protein
MDFTKIEARLIAVEQALRQMSRAALQPRGRTNLRGAAQYLGVCDESLRERHKQGRGPRRAKNGPKYRQLNNSVELKNGGAT